MPLVDMEKIYDEMKHYTKKDWEKVDQKMKQIIDKREKEEKEHK